MNQNKREEAHWLDLMALTVRIAAAYLRANPLRVSSLPKMLDSIHDSLSQLGKPKPFLAVQGKPAIPVTQSVAPDGITCLECGKKSKMLKQHLRHKHGLSPEGYRIKWGLPGNYPMVAANYAAIRSNMAKASGFGRRSRSAPTPVEEQSKTRQPNRRKAST